VPTKKLSLPLGQSLRVADQVLRVPLDLVDLQDRRCQHRLSVVIDDLVDSLHVHGQQVPVILSGSKPPYKIVDGFRRIDAAMRLGWESVQAIVRGELDHRAAFSLGFLENVKRRNLTPMDKANAVYQAASTLEMTEEDVAEAFGLSTRQVKRYRALLDINKRLQQAVEAERISMAHAVLIHKSGVGNPGRWIDLVAKEGLSAQKLRKRLNRAENAGRPKRYLKEEISGFRMYAFRIGPRTPTEEKARVREALTLALAMLDGLG